MIKTSYFNFFATDAFAEMGRVFVIITAEYKETSNNLYSEYFIFIEADKKMLGMRYVSKPIEFNNFKIDIGFMENQAIIGAEEAINKYVYEKFKESNINIYLNKDYSLKEWNWIPLIKIIKGDIFYKDIANLRSNSKSKSLKEFIDKVWDLDNFAFESIDLYK